LREWEKLSLSRQPPAFDLFIWRSSETRSFIDKGWAEDGNGLLPYGGSNVRDSNANKRKHVQHCLTIYFWESFYPQEATTEVIKFSYVWAAVFFTILSWSVERVLSQPIIWWSARCAAPANSNPGWW
jgi:hypothetical protein